jgi:FKBP-type peptidyl-prolyl cis-trans isomerase
MTVSTTARRFAAVLTVPLLIASAAACGSEEKDDAGAIPAVTTEDGKPSIDKGKGDPPKKLEVKVLKEGKGEKVAKGAVLQADYVGQLWGGKVFDSTWQKGRTAAAFPIGTGSVIKGWDKALVGKKLGSRVQMVIPPGQGYGKQGKPPQIPGNSTLVFVVDLKKTFPSEIDGKPVEKQNPDLPEVSTKVTDKAPEITIEKGAKAPEELLSATVVEGDGKEVGSDSKVLAQFKAKMWNGQDFADTWAQGGPQEFPVGQIPGWKEGLKGAKAGSRVVISVPQDEFPKEQREQFKGGVIFSVDVLGVS